MNSSPLQFARDFEQFKARFRNQTAADYQLLAALSIWPILYEQRDSRGYRGYFEEFAALLQNLAIAKASVDLLPQELEQSLAMVIQLQQVLRRSGERDTLQQVAEQLAKETARKFFYVGEINNGLACLAKGYGHDWSPREIVETGATHSELDLLRTVYSDLERENSALAPIVEQIARQWVIEHEAVSFEGANCLFVEKGGQGQAVRGRLRELHGDTVFRRKSADHHDITLDTQPRAPDDPFVGSLHQALDAVATNISPGNNNGGNGHFVRARFQVLDSDHTFTGDSIGLAAGLVAFVQLLRPEIHRQERFIATEAGFTGGLDADGNLVPVSEPSLKFKIERAFFSHLKYLVLPHGNFDTVQAHLEKLTAQYPIRRLHLVPASTFQEVIENLNVVRSEKLCPGQYLTRKAIKYSGATKIQVPILLLLLATMLAIIFPKWTPWFDDNPQYVRLTERGFDALNADSVRLWSVEYDCESIDSESNWRVGDIDSDDANEIAFAPMALETLACDSEGLVFVYNGDGSLIFSRSCNVVGEYPSSDWRGRVEINFAGSAQEPIVVTTVNKSFPTQSHIRFWSAEGNPLGWYIHPGMAISNNTFFLSNSDSTVIFLGINNDLGSTSLFVLKTKASFGVSPPYTHPDLDRENVNRGNQLCYILFPPSDLNRHYGKMYNAPHLITIEPEGLIRVETDERREQPLQTVFYYLDAEFRVVNVKLSDTFMEARLAMADSGTVSTFDWDTYAGHLRDSVRYWTDSGWVTEGELRALSQ